MCVEKIAEIGRKTGANSFVGVFSYAGMPPAEAERNLTLFAKAVMPELKRLPAFGAPDAPMKVAAAE
jgi:hypothetical protein